MNVQKALLVGTLALGSAGCGGGTTVSDSATHRQLLEDVPELRAAYATGGSGAAGATSGSARSGAPSLPVSFTGTQQLSGTFGGPRRATDFAPDCRGYVSAEPNHVVYNGGEQPFLQLVVNANPYDTTLVVERPDGSFVCNDDTHGLNPAIVFQPAPAGQLRIWVGSYSEGETGPYRLAVTTDPAIDASTVGPPAP